MVGVHVPSVVPQKPTCVGVLVAVAVRVLVGVHVPAVTPQKPTRVGVRVGV